MKYRKKPVVIEAVRWTGDNLIECIRFCEAIARERQVDGKLTIPTLEGKMIATTGDYIIKGVKGEFYPCKPDVFGATYEPVYELEPAVEGVGA